MQFLILTAGKPSLGYAKEGVELYLNRLRPFGKTELKLVRDGNSQDVSKRLLAASAVPVQSYPVLEQIHPST